MGNVGYQNYYTLRHLMGFPGGSDGKKSACNVGDPGLIPGQGTKIPQVVGQQSLGATIKT